MTNPLTAPSVWLEGWERADHQVRASIACIVATDQRRVCGDGGLLVTVAGIAALPRCAACGALRYANAACARCRVWHAEWCRDGACPVAAGRVVH